MPKYHKPYNSWHHVKSSAPHEAAAFTLNFDEAKIRYLMNESSLDSMI